MMDVFRVDEDGGDVRTATVRMAEETKHRDDEMAAHVFQSSPSTSGSHRCASMPESRDDTVQLIRLCCAGI